MSVERKNKTLTIGEKISIIKAVKSDTKKKLRDIAGQYGIPTSTLSTILRNQDTILSHEHSVNLNTKRRKKSKFPDVEENLLEWIKECCDSKVNVGGKVIKLKAEAVALSLGYENFKASNGWLEKFKKRHNIGFLKMSSESESVCKKLKVEDAAETIFENYYIPHSIFGSGDTGLFFKCLPDRTMCFKDERCHSGKHSI